MNLHIRLTKHTLHHCWLLLHMQVAMFIAMHTTSIPCTHAVFPSNTPTQQQKVARHEGGAECWNQRRHDCDCADGCTVSHVCLVHTQCC